ncbi:unnamed protein product, partial [Darwinula stevensoni]
MPDMGHAVSYEANVLDDYYYNTWDKESVKGRKELSMPRQPIAGTMPRGYAGVALAQDGAAMMSTLRGYSAHSAIATPAKSKKLNYDEKENTLNDGATPYAVWAAAKEVKKEVLGKVETTAKGVLHTAHELHAQHMGGAAHGDATTKHSDATVHAVETAKAAGEHVEKAIDNVHNAVADATHGTLAHATEKVAESGEHGDGGHNEVLHAAEGHGEEHHAGGEFKMGFTVPGLAEDHKTIAKQFLITGMIWAFIGAAMSIVFRLQLGFPEESLAWLKPILGKWIVLDDATGMGKLAPEFYYALVTMHGTIIVFFVLTAGLSGTFSNLLIPLQIGARDMASGFLNMLSYWFFFLSGIIMFFSLFLNTGPFSGGWTAYPPLSALPQASTGSQAGATMWLVSMTFFIVSVLLGGINYITTILNLRTKGLNMWRLPLTIWAFLLTAIIGLLSFPVLASGAFLLMFDRSLGTSFYLSEIFIGGKALDNVGGSPILFQHLFWFLGHPEVYIIILPAMGLVSEVLSVHCRKPIFGYKAMVFSMLAIGFLSFIVWAHHMFMAGVNPFISNFFVIFTLIIAVPSAVKVFNWIATIWGGNIRFNSASLFAIGFVSMFISGGLTGIFLGNSAIDIVMHDTYFVVAHFHVVMGVAAFFGMFAGIYHWFPKMYGRFMNETLGKIHFWGTLIGAYCVFWPMHYLGMAGVPRRYYSFEAFDAFKHFDATNKFITISAIVTFFLQVLFMINFFHSIWKGRVCTNKNPWDASTLEWTTPIKPGHGNWTGKIPSVQRWAYDYSKDDRGEAISQIVPLEAGELKVRLTALVVFSAVIAYLISADGDINWNALGVLALGGFLVTAAANALNQVLEREYDKLMKRTADRPLPAGRMTISAALLAAGLMSLVGVALLTSLNPMTGFLGTISLISYAFIYTPMKRVSPIAVFIGAFPGALPMAIGSVAVTGILTSVSLVLFAIQFLWQFPHFWAIAWVGHEDYSKAGFRLLPSHNNELDASIGFYSFLYALALLGVSILPYFMG